MVMKGSDKKKVGNVLHVIPDDEKVIVAGVNIRTAHKKARTRNEKGTIEKKERPISISNVLVIDPKTKEPSRVQYTGTGKEKKRMTKKNGTMLEKKQARKKTAKKTVVAAKSEEEKNKQKEQKDI